MQLFHRGKHLPPLPHAEIAFNCGVMSNPLAHSNPRSDHRLLGIAYRCGAVVCFAVMAGGVKLAADQGVSTTELIFYRNLFSLPIVLLWLALGPGFAAIRTQRPRAHLTRAAIGLVSMFVNFQALVMLPLAEATTIGFAAPLFATMLSALVLGEQIGRHRWGAVALGFAGVIIVMQPGSSALPLDGLGVAIVAAFGVASVVITIRQIGATEQAATTVFWFNIASLLVVSLPMPWIAQAHSLEVLVILFVMSVAGGIAQILMTSSLRCAPVAVLAPFDYFQLLWATAIGWILWTQTPSPSTLAGGILIAASGIYTGYREHRLHRRAIAAMSTPPQL
jgi:drug/metabolite transporter (DMT)-like permease